MDWDHLRVFLAVARDGQLLSAAHKLGLKVIQGRQVAINGLAEAAAS